MIQLLSIQSHTIHENIWYQITDVKHAVWGTPVCHISLLLFTLYINDIKKVIHHRKFLLFADDLQLFLEIRSIHDCQLLHSDLCALDACAVNIGLDFNVIKVCSKSFYRGRTHLEFNIYFVEPILLLKGIR